GRAHGPGPRRLRGGRRGEPGAAGPARPRGGQGSRPGRDDPGGDPALFRGRQAAHPVRDEPGRQRAQVHAGGARRGPGRGAGRRPAIRGGRHRHRHPGRAGRPHLRGVPPGRRHGQPGVRGHRARAVDHPEAGRAARRPDLGRERRGEGLDLLLPGPGAPRAGGGRMKTVLYVEDNEFNRKIVRHLLARTAYRLIEATDGEAGVATAREARPDLVIMDIQLPKLSGLDATRRLQIDPVTASIPVIVITSFALAGDEEKAREAGAAAYLAKPYSPRELLQLIRELAPEACRRASLPERRGG